MTVTEADLLDMIAEAAFIDREKLTRDAALDDLGISSLNVVTMLFELEERCGVRIEEMPMTRTLGEMVDLVIARIDAESATL